MVLPNYLSQKKPFSTYNNNQSNKNDENIDLYKIPRNNFYDKNNKREKRVFYTTRHGIKIPVKFPPIRNQRVECQCKYCTVIFPYITIENNKVTVTNKKRYIEYFNTLNKNCQNNIYSFNFLLSKHSNYLPYRNPSFLDARYSSIRCIIDKNNNVGYYCLLKKIVNPTLYKPIFTPIAHDIIPEYIKKILYLKYLQDNAVVTLASFKKKNQY